MFMVRSAAHSTMSACPQGTSWRAFILWTAVMPAQPISFICDLIVFAGARVCVYV